MKKANLSISNLNEIENSSKVKIKETTNYTNEDSIKYNSNWEEKIQEFPSITPIGKVINLGNISNKIISGKDDRIRVQNTTISPWKMVCSLWGTNSSNQKYMGTGFFISPRCIITNGHVVFPNNNWAKKIEVIPGLNENIAPFGKEISTQFYSVTNWTEQENMNYDYGAIILPNNNLYNKIKKHFECSVFSDNDKEITICGYPSDKPTGTAWYHKDIVIETTKKMIHYNVDTYGGQSGSPVWNKNNKVIGIHGYGGHPNKAIKITSEVINNFNLWKTK